MVKKQLSQNKKVKVVLFISLMVLTGIGMFTAQANAIYIPPTSQVFRCSGYVRDSSGTPIVGATLTLVQDSDPDTGIHISTTSSSTGYYSFSVTTTSYVWCTLSVSKSGYHGQTKSVYSKGTVTVNFNLNVISPKFVLKCAATDVITNGEANAIEVEMDMYSTYAIVWIRIRFRMGCGFISIYNCWPDNPHVIRTAVLRNLADGSTTPLVDVFDEYNNGYIWYDDQGFDFGNNLVEIDYQLKLLKASGKPQFTIELYTIARMNANNIIGLQEFNLHDNADGQITFNEGDVTLTNFYFAWWNSMVKTLFINDAIWGQYGKFMKISLSLNGNVYGKFGYTRNPCPHFLFNWI